MRQSGKILWREIEEVLSDDIVNGIYPAGSRLPKEAELALRFGVNRHTIRQALAALRDRGAISIEQGRGMFVRAPRLAYPISQRTRYTENISRLDQKLRFSGRLLRKWAEPAGEHVARDLDISEGQTCVAFDDLREINDEPVSLTTHRFPAARFEGIADIFEELGSITQSLKRFDVDDYQRRFTRTHAREATLEEAAALQIRHGAPVLVVEAINVDEGGVPIELGVTRSQGGRFEVIFET